MSTKLPDRRELRAMMLSAMATTLDNDVTGTAAGYLYDIAEDATASEAQAYYARMKAVGAELAAEFDRRAEKLRSRR